jgi:hypothetical protein
VCAVYDVPPPVVHILDRATFSNITEQMRSMYRDTMAPRLGLYESVLDTQLRPDFDPRGDLYAEFLMDEVLRGSFEQRAAAYETMTRIGGMTPAEVRKAENLPVPGRTPTSSTSTRRRCRWVRSRSGCRCSRRAPDAAAGQSLPSERRSVPRSPLDAREVRRLRHRRQDIRPRPVPGLRGQARQPRSEGVLMDLVKKAVGLVETVETDSPNGAFEVVLSAATLDRDGEIIDSRAFDPLPDHVPFDIDHGMTVQTTVGSGTRTTPRTGRCGSRARSPPRRSRRRSAPSSPRGTSGPRR